MKVEVLHFGGNVKIAIVGSGIGGLSAAASLFANGHNVTIYEANDYIGGHAKTVRVPLEDNASHNESDHFPVELGVFMFDPKYIHPMMGAKIKELGIKIKEIPITFTFQNQKHNLSWSTKSQFSGLPRNLSILFKTVRKSLLGGKLTQNVSFLLELRRFFSAMPQICSQEEYRHMSLKDYVAKHQCSESFLDNWLLPQIMCWWGVTHEHAMSINIRVVVQSMYLVSIAPQYMFEGGWSQFVEKLSAPFRNRIRTDCPVSKVTRKDNSVEVKAQGRAEIYDHLIFATPPSVVGSLLHHPSAQEDAILKSYQTITTTVYLHRDIRWLPRNEESALINLIQDQRGDFCTINFGEFDMRKPKILITWGDNLKEIPDRNKTITIAKWLRTLPTVKYTDACYAINAIQGNQGVWYCGAHVDALDPEMHQIAPSLWHENSFRSGLEVANKIIGIKNG